MSLLEQLKQHKPFDTPDDTLEVLVYEIGEVSKCIHHARNFPTLKDGYRGELFRALADSLAQIMVLSEWYGFSFQELLQMGRVRFVESLKEKFPRDAHGET